MVLTRTSSTGAAKHAFTLLAITTPRPINSLIQCLDVSDVTGQHGRDHPSVEVTVRDMNLGLTSKVALIGTRRLSSAVNTVRVHCTDNYSGERTKTPNAEVDSSEGDYRKGTRSQEHVPSSRIC